MSVPLRVVAFYEAGHAGMVTHSEVPDIVLEQMDVQMHWTEEPEWPEIDDRVEARTKGSLAAALAAEPPMASRQHLIGGSDTTTGSTQEHH